MGYAPSLSCPSPPPPLAVCYLHIGGPVMSCSKCHLCCVLDVWCSYDRSLKKYVLLIILPRKLSFELVPPFFCSHASDCRHGTVTPPITVAATAAVDAFLVCLGSQLDDPKFFSCRSRLHSAALSSLCDVQEYKYVC